MTEADQTLAPGDPDLQSDFDLHGLVGIRLVDATRDDIAVVRRQLGLPPTTLEGEPDIVVRFADEVTSRPLTYVGLQDAGFNEDGFVVLRGNGGRPVRALVPFADIGNRPELVCRRGAATVPHLLAILNLTALSKGVLPLHASAYVADGTGVLVTGWSKGGKTEALLAASSRGAHYVGDEWVFLTPDGTMYGLPERIRLWAWHLDQLPEVRGSRSRGERRRLFVWRSMATAANAAASSSSPGGRLAGRAAPVLERQAYVQVPPSGIVGEAKVDLSGSLDAVVLVLSSSSPNIETRRTHGSEVARRMAASLTEERAPLLAHYRQFLFAFPDLRSELVDQADELEAKLLSQLFDGRPAATVVHPYPCDIAALGDAVAAAATDLTSTATSISTSPSTGATETGQDAGR